MCWSFRRLGVPVYNLRIRWNNPLAIWRLFKVLRRIKPHIVQTYVLNTNIFGRIAGIIAKVPVIIGTELTLKDQVSSKAKCIRDWFLYPLNSLLHLLSDSVIFVSEAVKQEWVGETISAKYQVIYSPFNYEKFRSVSNYEKQFLQNKAGPMLGIVARLSEEKGHTDLLDSLPKILKWFPGTKLIVVGTGYLEECLRQRVVNLGLENHVTFEGHKKNVFEGLSKLDIFVLPSRSEGMGIAIVEAMAMGLPVVATKVGGIPEVVVEDIIDYIFGLLKETFPATFNPYTAVRLIGAAMQKIMPQVMAERPDIVQELIPRLFAFPSEILAKTLKSTNKE